MAAEKQILVLQAFGSFVYKNDVRNALNIKLWRHWKAEIEILNNLLGEDFVEQMQQYQYAKRLPIDLARKIVETILERSGEEFELRFERQ